MKMEECAEARMPEANASRGQMALRGRFHREGPLDEGTWLCEGNFVANVFDDLRKSI